MMDKNLLMQPLSEEELAGVNGGAGSQRTKNECDAICGQYEDAAPMVYAQCMAACMSGRSVMKYM